MSLTKVKGHVIPPGEGRGRAEERRRKACRTRIGESAREEPGD